MPRSRTDDPPLYRRGRIFFTWAYGPDGKRVQRSTHQTSREAALSAAREIRRRIASGQATHSSRPTLRKGLEALLAHDERAQRARATVTAHALWGRNLIRILGASRDLRTLTLEDTQGYVDRRLAENVSRKTVHHELACLRHVCALMKVERAPMPDLGNWDRPGTRWLPEGEYRRLLAALPAERRDYVILWCNTGMRKGELFAVEREDVDLDGPQGPRLWVRGTKTEKSPRWVPLTEDAAEVLARRLADRRDPLFPRWSHVYVALARACAKAGIELCSPVDFRRTFISWMACEGVSSLKCSRLAGHSSTRMVEKVYARLAPESLADAVKTLPKVRRGRPGADRRSR